MVQTGSVCAAFFLSTFKCPFSDGGVGAVEKILRAIDLFCVLFLRLKSKSIILVHVQQVYDQIISIAAILRLQRLCTCSRRSLLS